MKWIFRLPNWLSLFFASFIFSVLVDPSPPNDILFFKSICSVSLFMFHNNVCHDVVIPPFFLHVTKQHFCYIQFHTTRGKKKLKTKTPSNVCFYWVKISSFLFLCKLFAVKPTLCVCLVSYFSSLFKCGPLNSQSSRTNTGLNNCLFCCH